MKRLIRFIPSLIAVALFCFAISAVPIHSVNNVYDKSDLDKESISAVGTVQFYGLAKQTESSVSSYKNSSFPSLKNWVGGSSGTVKSITYLLYIPLLQYTSYLRSFPISFGKVDIIFPFHYFW